jgi:hypothetical protein
MALIFMDGFDHYYALGDFWDFAGNDTSTRRNGTSRTGIGCLQINSGAFGPQKSFSQHLTNVLICTAWNSSGNGTIMQFLVTDLPGVGTQLRVFANADGSISFAYGSTGAVQGTTAAGLVTFGTYNSIAVQVQNFTANTGIITCWVNGVQVFHKTGLHTADFASNLYCNGIQLMGPGGIPTCFHDDVYVLDCSTAPNTTFLGALKLYALAPTADGAPVAWTPLAGANWSEVSEIPPDGDTSYNSSANIGDVDQYIYPLTGVPANSAILLAQHDLDMEVDSGSRSVASDLNGIVNAAATALPNGYHIYPTPYDVNPSTGVAFVTGDFPIQAGPKVTA